VPVPPGPVDADLGCADAGRADAGRADAGRADAGRADAGRADRVPMDRVPIDRAVLVLDGHRVRWTSDPRGPDAMAGLFHAGAAADSWVTATGEPCRRADLPVFRALAERVPVTGELMGHRGPDGSTRWLLLTVHPVDWQGDEAVSVVIEDAAPMLARDRLHRRMEAQLAQAARPESLGRLAGEIAHDVNNLLGAIGIQVELAERAVRRQEDPSTNLHSIGEALDRGVDLTRQLLAFRRQAPDAR
jgi:signal transduction histidine kinase